MIDDVSIQNEFFDPDFFVYQKRGCGCCLASPVDGMALHLYARCARLSRAQCAAGQPARCLLEINMALGEEPLPDAHLANADLDLYRRNWFSITTRDLVRLQCLSFAGSARRLKAYSRYMVRNWRRVLAKRREIMSRRRAKDSNT